MKNIKNYTKKLEINMLIWINKKVYLKKILFIVRKKFIIRKFIGKIKIFL